MQSLTFEETEIQRLFGHEAAEDEEPERLRAYYFKSDTYDKVITELPLRILVGHKGIGKSALFKVAIAEDNDHHELPILIRPDDILGLAPNASDFLQLIRDWKKGLLTIIAQKALTALGSDEATWKAKTAQVAGKLIDFILQTVQGQESVSLDPTRKAIAQRLSRSRRVVVYIDDLDRGWQGQRENVVRISALLNAVRDIASEHKGVLFKISLRSDVYFLVRTSDESTDKIEGSVVWHTWLNHEIFALLVKRIETFFGRSPHERDLLSTPQPVLARYLEPVMEPMFQGTGHWNNAPIYRVLMSLIRKRPRDLVKLCTLAARAARSDGAKKILTGHFQGVFEEYSQGRIQDTVNEFRSELPDIERLLMNMKPNRKERTTKAGYVYKTDALLQKIGNIMQSGAFRLQNGREATAKGLASFMYKINFLTARKEAEGRIVRKYFEENRYLSSQFADFGFDWEIHPAYRWALQPESIEDIFRSLQLSGDD